MGRRKLLGLSFQLCPGSTGSTCRPANNSPLRHANLPCSEKNLNTYYTFYACFGECLILHVLPALGA